MKKRRCRTAHGPLRADRPLVYRRFVNINYRCTKCGRVVQVTSWTKKAWLERR